MNVRLATACLGALALAACTAVPPSELPQPQTTAAVAEPTPAPAPTPLPPAEITLVGQLTQGGWARGVAPSQTESLTLDGTPVPIAADGQFVIAFDRDADGTATLVATRRDSSTVRKTLAISPRDWRIERIDAARRTAGPSEAFMRRRMPELEKIVAARANDTGSTGWRQDFIWPAKGRISGLFGSQRIYRGEPGSYHSGIDIAPGAGVPFVSPADGVVVLAEQDFSLEGKLIIIDHGMGLNSAFLHAQRIDVAVGDRVRQGQQIGLIGSSGRATGPHLHWGLKWGDARLDPLLFTGPMRD